MYRAETLKKDATTRAAGFLNKIDKAVQDTKGFSELTTAIMDTATVVLEQAMKDAYFKGLRDATWVYEDKEDLQYLKDAISKASEELNNNV
jgi:hypothetical protein